MSGKDYDRFAGDYTPNKDRRMAEWRAKKAKQRKESEEAHREKLKGIASEIARKESEKEERRELKGPIQHTPFAPKSETPASPPVQQVVQQPKPRKSRRKWFDNPDQRSLFDGVE